MQYKQFDNILLFFDTHVFNVISASHENERLSLLFGFKVLTVSLVYDYFHYYFMNTRYR